MFKKILSFLLEENEDVVVEEELEKVDFGSISNADLTDIVEQPKRVDVLRPLDERKEEVKAEPEVRNQSIDIRIETPVKAEPEKAVRVKNVSDVKKEYEFTPVISPMFGQSEVKKPVKKERQIQTSSAMPKKSNPLGTIISPMYGQRELDEFEAEAQKKIEDRKNEVNKKEEIKVDEILDTMMESKPDSDSILEKLIDEGKMNESLSEENEVTEEKEPVILENTKSVMENISLDELLLSEHEVAGEDCIQFSLFGESTNIHDIENNNN